MKTEIPLLIQWLDLFSPNWILPLKSVDARPASMGSTNTLISVVQRSMFIGQKVLNTSFWVPSGRCTSLGIHESIMSIICTKSPDCLLDSIIVLRSPEATTNWKNWQWYRWLTAFEIKNTAVRIQHSARSLLLAEVCQNTFSSVLIILSIACWHLKVMQKCNSELGQLFAWSIANV